MCNQRSLAVISWPVTAARRTRHRAPLRAHITSQSRNTLRHATKTMENFEVVDFSSLSEEIQNLLKEARDVRERAYVPYSKFKVGAAVVSEQDGRVFAGCNVENAAFTPTLCAERACIGTCVAAGHLRLRAAAVVAQQAGWTAPCGVCRQALSEFRAGDGDMRLYLARPALDRVLCTTLSRLLPLAFLSFDEEVNIVK